MSWPEKYLNELGFVGRGKSKHRPRNDSVLYGGDFPFIQTGDVKNAQLYVDKYSVSYNDVGLAQSKLWPVNTLCITIAANIADTAILAFEACFPDSIIGFVADPKLANVFFVKYFYTTFQKNLQQVSQGAAQDNLNLEKLLTYPIPCPPIEIQNKIASILYRYDDLIQTNQQRITLLEEAAQHLYDEWFVKLRFPNCEHVAVVDGVPEAWEKVKLSDIAKINSRSIKKDEFEYIRYVDISAVGERHIQSYLDVSVADAAGRAKRKVQHGDIIWSCVRPNRRQFAMIWEPVANLIVSTGFCTLTAIQVPFSYLYSICSDKALSDYLESVATGSAYPAVTASDFENYDVLKPTNEILQKYHTVCLPLLNQAESLKTMNAKLIQVRDELLPRLMSGQFDVSKLTLAKVA